MEKRTNFVDFIDKIQRQDRYIKELEEENKTLKEKLSEITMVADDEKQSIEHILELEEENKKLKEFKTKREESMFYFKAQMERAEPKTAREAEDLQRAKEIFEELYREELHCLEEENKKLKSDLANIQCEFWFECDECEFWKREMKKHKPCLIKDEYVFNLWDYDYMILTSTTPQLKIIKKNNKGISTFTVK